MSNPISIVATTYAPDGEEGRMRSLAWATALASWQENLIYDDTINLIVADDGSNDWAESLQMIATKLWTRGVITWTKETAKGVGGSLNRGFQHAYAFTDVLLYAVDDWSLLHDFDINPWVQLLNEREDVGVVRLGPPHPGNILDVRPYTANWQGWVGRIMEGSSSGIIVSERPALWHKRMYEAFGRFKEDCTALECEADYDRRFHQLWHLHRLDVVLALPHPWMHLNPSEMSNRDPKDRQ